MGQKLHVRADMGRSKIVESEGVLTGSLPASSWRLSASVIATTHQSYQYVDVLTGMGEKGFPATVNRSSARSSRRRSGAGRASREGCRSLVIEHSEYLGVEIAFHATRPFGAGFLCAGSQGVSSWCEPLSGALIRYNGKDLPSLFHGGGIHRRKPNARGIQSWQSE